jgi:hypothetical protein
VSTNFIEFCKRFIDKLNTWHWQQPFTKKDLNFCKTTNSIHYYDSIVVFEKRPEAEKPLCEEKRELNSGNRIWDDNKDWENNQIK